MGPAKATPPRASRHATATAASGRRTRSAWRMEGWTGIAYVFGPESLRLDAVLRAPRGRPAVSGPAGWSTPGLVSRDVARASITPVTPPGLRRAHHGRKDPIVRVLRIIQPATLVLGIATFSAHAAFAGAIRGTLRVPESAGTAAPHMRAYAGSANAMPGKHGAVHGQVTDAVIYVARIPAAAESALAAVSAQRPKLAQKNESFVPRVVPVAVGTTVDFPNLDPIYHNVFSLSPVKRFDLGKYPRGQSKAVIFNRPGLVNVFCDIHSEMAAYVLVL